MTSLVKHTLVREVPAFCDYWSQKVIMKCEDYETEGITNSEIMKCGDLLYYTAQVCLAQGIAVYIFVKFNIMSKSMFK